MHLDQDFIDFLVKDKQSLPLVNECSNQTLFDRRLSENDYSEMFGRGGFPVAQRKFSKQEKHNNDQNLINGYQNNEAFIPTQVINKGVKL